MDNISLNILAPSTKDIKADKSGIRASESSFKDNDNTFESQLSKIKSKDTKLSKSILKNNVKDIAVSKSIEIKELDEMENKESVDNMIMMLINNVLEIPVEELNMILEQMNIEPTDLLNPETFKAFLTYAYPGEDENQLLFEGEKLKDISKLFVKLEQISTLIQGEQNNLLIERLVVEDEVIKTTTTQMQAGSETEEEKANTAVNAQIITPQVQPKGIHNEQTAENINIEESLLEGSLSEEGLLNFKQMGLGMNIPIQAFNTTISTKLWDAQGTKANLNQSVQEAFLATQIVNKIDISSLANHKEITMDLSPKELGNLSIKLAETNGVLVAHIRVENEKTKELLLGEIAQLEQTLEKQGLSISEVRVDVRQNEHHSQMEKERQKSGRRIQELIDRHLSEAEESSMQVDEKTGELIETEVNYIV